MGYERIEHTPGLFGRGLGTSTYGDITCEVCGKSYNEGADEKEDYTGDSIGEARFGDITVCECCFGKVENAVLQHMGDILPWYRRYLEGRKAALELRFGQLQGAESMETVVAPFLEGWQPMQTAPKNATWVWLLFADGKEERAHWAHGGGEDQPIFGPGWFMKGGGGFWEISGTPYAWKPERGKGS